MDISVLRPDSTGQVSTDGGVAHTVPRWCCGPSDARRDIPRVQSQLLVRVNRLVVRPKVSFDTPPLLIRTLPCLDKLVLTFSPPNVPTTTAKPVLRLQLVPGDKKAKPAPFKLRNIVLLLSRCCVKKILLVVTPLAPYLIYGPRECLTIMALSPCYKNSARELGPRAPNT